MSTSAQVLVVLDATGVLLTAMQVANSVTYSVKQLCLASMQQASHIKVYTADVTAVIHTDDYSMTHRVNHVLEVLHSDLPAISLFIEELEC
jgi:hypothetical protein